MFGSSQTWVTQTRDDVREKYSAIYSLGDVNPNTFCTMLLYLLAYRRCAKKASRLVNFLL